jgi:hypothetical protein
LITMTAGKGPFPSGTQRYASTVSFPLRYDTAEALIFSPAVSVAVVSCGKKAARIKLSPRTADLIRFIVSLLLIFIRTGRKNKKLT